MTLEVRHICLWLDCELSFQSTTYLQLLLTFVSIQLLDEPNLGQIFGIVFLIFTHTNWWVGCAHLLVFLTNFSVIFAFELRVFSPGLSDLLQLSFWVMISSFHKRLLSPWATRYDADWVISKIVDILPPSFVIFTTTQRWIIRFCLTLT